MDKLKIVTPSSVEVTVSEIDDHSISLTSESGRKIITWYGPDWPTRYKLGDRLYLTLCVTLQEPEYSQVMLVNES